MGRVASLGLVALLAFPVGAPAAAPAPAPADEWNLPNDNYFKCARLKPASAPLRYADFSRIKGRYRVFDDLTYRKPPNTAKGYCPPGKVRLDAHELLRMADGRELYFHKGGQGYGDPRTPYGHIWSGDLENRVTPGMSGPPENGNLHGNGKGCELVLPTEYRVHVTRQGTREAIPKSWQYKPRKTSSRYDKYADAGAEQGDGSRHYAYLTWSWMLKGNGRTKSRGGGQVRTLLREEQPFFRCNVAAIKGRAWKPGLDRVVGRVTAVYGATRAGPNGPWVYGWAIESHQPRKKKGGYGGKILHLMPCATPC